MTAAVPRSDRQAEVEAALCCRAGWACPRRTGDGPGPAGQCRPSPSTSRETRVVVVSRVVTLGSRSGPRWLMALADCRAAEMLGARDAWFG